MSVTYTRTYTNQKKIQNVFYLIVDNLDVCVFQLSVILCPNILALSKYFDIEYF